MYRQLQPPLLIEPIASAEKLTSSETYDHLGAFLLSLPPSPARTQLERLTDALGVEIGAIAPSEGDRREAQRLVSKPETRRMQESAPRRAEAGGMAGGVEGLEGEEMEEGAVGVEGEEGMDEKGDVEYGGVAEREGDEDEPDNQDGKTDAEEKE